MERGEQPIRSRGVPHASTAAMTDEMQRCIEDCLDCQAICLSSSQYCLQLGGELAQVGHIRTLLDCADICQTAANFMLRNSPLHGATCGTCAQVSMACAKACEQFGADPQMLACAEMCRRCADSCTEMAAAMSGAKPAEHGGRHAEHPPI